MKIKTPTPSRYEVEMKFRLTDEAALEASLASRRLVLNTVTTQRDLFFQHPSRNFAETDEGLRLRIESSDVQPLAQFITYKGPKIDAITKTRREIDLPLTGNSNDWSELLQALGFTPSAEICKERSSVTWIESGRDWTLTRDRILPSSLWIDGEKKLVVPPECASLFCEIETVVTTTDDTSHDLNAPREQMLKIAASFGLTDSVRTSYLEIVVGFA
ncbi:MAG: class IV adenylate cyclase [Thermoguttaceae bacterium]